MRGVPIRLEIGPRDIDAGVVTAVTRDGERSALRRENIVCQVEETGAQFESRLWKKAQELMEKRIARVRTAADIPSAMKKGVAIVPWCGEIACAEELARLSGGSILGLLTESGRIGRKEDACLICGKAAAPALLGRAY
jgi:prolyl-tRNA synthetase